MYDKQKGESMSIQHISYSTISKKHNQSIIAAIAYASRQKMYDEAEGKTKYPHTSKQDLLQTEVMLPPGTSKKFENAETLWNSLNNIEKDRIAKSIILPLPHELSKEDAIWMTKDFLNEKYVSKGFPVQVSFHCNPDTSGHNENLHAHITIAERQLIGENWNTKKSERPYVDEKGNILSKIDSPVLKKGKLQYDKNGNLLTKPGWQKLEYNTDGTPKLDENEYPILTDIRVPVLDEHGNQKTEKSGKYTKPKWCRKHIKLHDMDDIGNITKFRESWQNHQNKFCREHSVKNENGNILQVDLRSYEEQYAHLPKDMQPIPTKHIGYSNLSDEIRAENDVILSHNKHIAELHNLKKEIRQAEAENKYCQEELLKQQKEEDEFVSSLNLKNSYIKRYQNAHKNVANRRKFIEKTLQSQIDISLAENQRLLSKTNPVSAEAKRLQRHQDFMRQIKNTIVSTPYYSDNQIAIAASDYYDKLSNKQIITYANGIYKNSPNLSIIVSRSIHRRIDRADVRYLLPSIKNDDIRSTIDSNINKWTAGDAPPAELVSLMLKYQITENEYQAGFSHKRERTPLYEYGRQLDLTEKEYQEELEAQIKAEQIKEEALKKEEAEAKLKAEFEAEIIAESEKDKELKSIEAEREAKRKEILSLEEWEKKYKESTKKVKLAKEKLIDDIIKNLGENASAGIGKNTWEKEYYNKNHIHIQCPLNNAESIKYLRKKMYDVHTTLSSISKIVGIKLEETEWKQLSEANKELYKQKPQSSVNTTSASPTTVKPRTIEFDPHPRPQTQQHLRPGITTPTHVNLPSVGNGTTKIDAGRMRTKDDQKSDMEKAEERMYSNWEDVQIKPPPHGR